VRLAQRVVRVAAGLSVAGAAVEGACLLWSVGASVPWQPALAVGLRLLAGTAMVLTLRLVPHGTGGRRSYDIPALPEAASRRHTGSGGTTRAAQLVLTPPVRAGRVHGVPAHPITAAAICLTMLASFLFDGHTSTVTPAPLIAAAALAHTAAAAVWVGGVILLATLLLVRARAGVPTGAGELAVRFSVPATAAVVVAGIAGTAMARLIIDSPTDLIGTAWGRILLIKLGLVTVVAIMGYVNNRYALPALDAWHPQDRPDPATHCRGRSHRHDRRPARHRRTRRRTSLTHAAPTQALTGWPIGVGRSASGARSIPPCDLPMPPPWIGAAPSRSPCHRADRRTCSCGYAASPP
jgi:copper transport protein